MNSMVFSKSDLEMLDSRIRNIIEQPVEQIEVASVFLWQYIITWYGHNGGCPPGNTFDYHVAAAFLPPQVLLRPMMVVMFLRFPGHLDDRSIGHGLWFPLHDTKYNAVSLLAFSLVSPFFKICGRVSPFLPVHVEFLL